MSVPMKPSNNTPALPEMFGHMAPREIPEMDINDGIIRNYFLKKKTGQLTEVQRMRAEIAEYNEREVKANSNKLMEALMFGRVFEVRVAQAEADKAEAFARKLRAEAEGETLKMNHIEHQARINTILLQNENQSIKNDISKIERKEAMELLKIKLRDWGVNNDWTYEDRNG